MTQTLRRVRMSLMGQDSEFFLWDTQAQQVVPSYKYYKTSAEPKEVYLGGRILKKKYNPPIDEVFGRRRVCHYLSMGGDAKLFRDGLAVEVNTPPVSCRAFLYNDLRYALLKGEPSRMPKHVVFTSRPVVDLTSKMMEDFPEDLRILGCNASLDAYTERIKSPQVDPMKTYFRTSGAHLHMSFAGYGSYAPVPEDVWTPLIKMADLALGIPHVVIFGDELERKRRTLYGQAGEFRFQPSYGGLEYRVLSSRIWDHQAIAGLFTGLWKYFIGNAGDQMWTVWDPAWEDDIRRAINEVNVELAIKLLPVWLKLIRAATLYTYTIGKDPFSSEDNTVRAFQFLRGLVQQGEEIKDGGIWAQPFAPDAHVGWRDVWTSQWLPKFQQQQQRG